MQRYHPVLCTGFVASVLIAAPVCAPAQDHLASEQQKIEALIAQVESLKQAKFVRNGREYDAGTAARFLRGKWKAREDEIRTARDFIEKVASASSTSGQSYLIRFADGTEQKSREFLLSALKSLKAAPAGVEANGEGKRERKDARPKAADPAAPHAQDSPSEAVELTIRQRDVRAVPGLKHVRIRLGDITEGRVLLSVSTATGEMLLEPTAVRQGEWVEISLGGEAYEIRVLELANALVGEDFATIQIARTASPNEPNAMRSFPNLSDPHGAAFSLGVALATGNKEAAESIFIGDDEAFPLLVDALSDARASARRLAKAAKDRYGENAATLASYVADTEPKFSQSPLTAIIAGAEVEQSADEAILTTPANWRIRVSKRGDKWYVTKWPRMPQITAFARAIAAVYEELAGEIESGKYEQAYEVWPALAAAVREASTESLQQEDDDRSKSAPR